MNAIALAVLAAASTPAQPLPPSGLGEAPATPPSEVRFVSKRTLNVPVNFKPERIAELREAMLFVSHDGGNLYEIGDRIDPAKTTEFNYTAQEDGEYWVQLQLAFKDGKLEPKDPSKLPPAEKVVIDTVKPVVVVTTAEMMGDEAVIEWRIDDKHPSDANTRIWYKPTGGGDATWQEVPATAIYKRTARFKPALAGPITVQVTTADLARNIGHMNKDVVGKAAITPTGGTDPIPGGPPSLSPDRPPSLSPGGPVPPAGLGAAPTPPSAFAPKEPEGTGAPLPAVNFAPDPPAASPPQPEYNTKTEALKPIASSTAPPSEFVPPAAGTPIATPSVEFSRTPRFDLNYTLDSGASGVARVDLYVTRDDGRTWVRWSQHDGRESPLKVVLDTRFNRELEGDYGFMLVPVSGAGLSHGAPVANTPPDLKVRLDTTAPVIKVYAPTADPNNKAALMLNWEATDKNFGRDPIAIEYAESPQGPWKSVTGTDGPSPTRLDNSGNYSWQPPLNLASPKVYLRFAAWDLAGNKSEVTTPQPILVDLTKPKAHIQGISLGGGR